LSIKATQLNQAAAGQAVKAVVNAILDALVAGDVVRVSGLGVFNVGNSSSKFPVRAK
jgi:nucleoid DNA-binding protein